MAQEPAATLPLSLTEPPLSEDLQPSSAVPSPTQPGPVLYMPSAAGDSVPVSPSSPHAPDLSAVRSRQGWVGARPPGSQHLLLVSPPLPPACAWGKPWGSALSAPGFFSLSSRERGWLVSPEPVLAWVKWEKGQSLVSPPPLHTYTVPSRGSGSPGWQLCPLAGGNGRHFLGCWRSFRLRRGWRVGRALACMSPTGLLPPFSTAPL